MYQGVNMSPRHFHKMMSPQFFEDPTSIHNKRYAAQEKAVEDFIIRLARKFNLLRFFKK